MNAGAWRLSGFNNDACTLIMNFLCLAAPESRNLSMNTPQENCGVLIQREELCSNHGGPGFAHKTSSSTRHCPGHRLLSVNTASPYTPYTVENKQLIYNGTPTPPLSRIRNRLLHGLRNLRPQPHPRLRSRHRLQIRPNTLLPRQR